MRPTKDGLLRAGGNETGLVGLGSGPGICSTVELIDRFCLLWQDREEGKYGICWSWTEKRRKIGR